MKYVCKKELWHEKHNPKHSLDDQYQKKQANVAKHKEEEDFYVSMAKNKV